jgi:hypothetical protein
MSSTVSHGVVWNNRYVNRLSTDFLVIELNAIFLVGATTAAPMVESVGKDTNNAITYLENLMRTPPPYIRTPQDVDGTERIEYFTGSEGMPWCISIYQLSVKNHDAILL